MRRLLAILPGCTLEINTGKHVTPGISGEVVLVTYDCELKFRPDTEYGDTLTMLRDACDEALGQGIYAEVGEEGKEE